MPIYARRMGAPALEHGPTDVALLDETIPAVLGMAKAQRIDAALLVPV